MQSWVLCKVLPMKTQASLQAQQGGPKLQYKYRPPEQCARTCMQGWHPTQRCCSTGTANRNLGKATSGHLSSHTAKGKHYRGSGAVTRARPGAGTHPVQLSAEMPCDAKMQCCGGMPSVGTAQWCIARSYVQILGESTSPKQQCIGE